MNEFDEEKLVGIVANQQTADYLNSSWDMEFEVNKPYNYSEWTSKDNFISSFFIKSFKQPFIDIGERLEDKPFYKRNGKIYAEGVAFIGEEYDSDSLPDYIPTFSPALDDVSSHIVMNMILIMITIFLLF